MVRLASSLLIVLFLLVSCRETEERSDAYGNFEAVEVIVSAEANGRILRLDVEEGQRLPKARRVGLIDTTQLNLQREQLRAAIRAVRQKTQDPEPQIEVLQEQKQNLLREKNRVEALLQDKAATPKQLDDIEGQIEVVDQQIEAARRQSRTANRGILAEIEPLQARIEQVEEQIRQSYIENPVAGTVLLKLAEPGEMAAAGKPLYKLASLDTMTLRVYVSGAQLPTVALGQEVTVWIDRDEESDQSLPGTVSWIASEAEFTPKNIQTKEERVNLVYAVKVRVPNDGRLKIGMPGEIEIPESTGLEVGASTTTARDRE